jgi:succinate dehydrogenase (ubiquinone) membrane anchor subunit
VNDPTTFPPPSKSQGAYHWTFERLLSAGLIPLTAAAFVTSGSATPLLDGLLGVGLIVHSHIGVRFLSHTIPHSCKTFKIKQFDTVLVDYVHKRKFPLLGPLLTWTLRLTSFAVGVGVYQFNTNDIGAFFFFFLSSPNGN